MLVSISVIQNRENEFIYVDINTPVKDLYNYDVCIFEIKINGENRFLNLKTLPDLSNYNDTFLSWMGARDFSGYLTVSDKNFYTTKRVKQYSLARAPFKPTNVSQDPTVEIDKNLCDDVMVTLPTIDAKELYDSCLVSVNGYFHGADYSDNIFYILNANRPYLRKGEFNVELLDFSELGGIDIQHLNSNSIVETRDGSAFVAMERLISEGLTPFIVLMGKLHIVRSDVKTITLVSDTHVKIDMDSLPFQILSAIEDGIITRQDLGLSELEDDVYLVSELTSDEIIKRVFDLPHTFMGYIGSERVHVRSRKLECLNNHNVYSFKSNAMNDVIFTNLGEPVAYSHGNEEGDNYISIRENRLTENYRIDDSRWKTKGLASIRKEPIDRYDNLHLYQMFITGEKK